MPKNIFDNDETFLDYDDVDGLAALGIGDRGYTQVNPPYGENDLFQDQFELRAREIQRQPNGLQPVSIVTLKNGNWTSNNQLGIERDFAPAANNQQTILKLDEWGFPEVWSVILGMKYSDTAWPSTGAADTFLVTAKINAGVGGATQELEVDWVQGTTFSLSMNALNVIAAYNPVLAGLSLVVPTDLRLAVTLSKGKVSGRPPTRSFLFPAILGGASSAINRIPPFAKSVMLLNRGGNAANSVYTANVSLLFFANPGGSSQMVNITGADLLNFASNGMPIPDGARYFQINVGVAQANTIPTALFFLGF